MRGDLDAEVLVQIVGGALLHHGQTHLVVAGGGGDRQLKTGKKVLLINNYFIAVYDLFAVFYIESHIYFSIHLSYMKICIVKIHNLV